jgi:hypothetical protein
MFPCVRESKWRQIQHGDNDTRKLRTPQLPEASRENTRTSFAPTILRRRRSRGSRLNTTVQIRCELPRNRGSSAHRVFRRKFGLPLFFGGLTADGLIVVLRVRLSIVLRGAIAALGVVVLSILHFVLLGQIKLLRHKTTTSQIQHQRISTPLS